MANAKINEASSNSALQQDTLFNDPHQGQLLDKTNNNALSTNKRRKKPTTPLSDATKLGTVLQTSHAVVDTSSLLSSCPCSIILEEGKDMPIFWNGENPVPLVKWGVSLKNKEERPAFSTVEEFLSNYTAGKYLRKCSMSLQVSTTKYINNLKMSDPFFKIFEYSQDGKPVTLMLAHANGDSSESGYSKFTLAIREFNEKKVLWNGIVSTNRIVAKLNQSDMGLTIENCLQNYIAKGYLSQNCQVDLVKDCSGSGIMRREELSTISTKDLVNTLFKGNSSSIVIRSVTNDSGSLQRSNDNNVQQSTGKELQDISQSSTTKIPVFISPPVQCHWIGMTWGGIKENVLELVNSVEITMRDTLLSSEAYAQLLEKKRCLVTAVRRRSRVVDEVWMCYLALQSAHADVRNGQRQRHDSAAPFQTGRCSLVRSCTAGDVDNALRAQRSSCIDFLSSTLIRCGMELELYDDETQGLSRVGVGVGLAAVVIAICAVAYYY